MLNLLRDNFVTSKKFISEDENDNYILKGCQDNLYYTVLYIKNLIPNKDLLECFEKIKMNYNIQLFEKRNIEEFIENSRSATFEFEDLINETNKKIEIDNKYSDITHYLVFKETSMERIKSSIIMTISLLKSLDFEFQDKDNIEEFIESYNDKNYESIGRYNKGLRLTTERKSTFYFNSCSSSQTTWINLITGIRNDKDKCLYLNNLNLKYFTGLSYYKDIPFLGIVAKDSSSLGFIETIENSIKYDNLLRVGKYKLEDNNFYLNPFDITLGYDTPDNLELRMLKKFISIIFTIDSDNSTIFNQEEIDHIIEQLYKNKKYCNTNEYREIKHELAKLKIYNEELSWRTIRNIFADAKNAKLAYFAHKQSMPIMSDLLDIVDLKQKKNKIFEINYYKIKNNIEDLVKSYSFLSKATTIDKEYNENITIIDLSLNNNLNKYKEVIYLAAANHIYKKYTDNSIFLYGSYKNINEGCIEIIKNREINRKYRRIVLDDIDLLKTNDNLSLYCNDALVDMAREARKCCMDMTYVMNGDIDRTLKNFMTSVFVFSGENNFIRYINFEKNRSHSKSTEKDKTISLYAWFETTTKSKSEYLDFNVTSKEYWATTPVKEEIELRKKCYDLYKGEKAREILSLTYPDGLTSLIKNDLYDEKQAFQEILKSE